ncbi:MAG: epimerase [Bacteroidaceae bacterium]|nr:epimerase [Bacteroidaceae bacterium]
MNILVLGGTGPMGVPLVQQLSKEHQVYVTSRSKRESSANITYIQGNAKEKEFLTRVFTMQPWDAVVDFMVYSVAELQAYTPLFLDNTKQYIFISSSRVYAGVDGLITENTPRLLEASQDDEYLKTSEYALLKARGEDVLLKSGRTNFTIIRPTITYNTYRLQLGVLEKENWLYRALHGRSIVFSEDVNDKLTTMTLGDDVAGGIISVIDEPKAMGEVFHVTSPISLPWHEVLATYVAVLKKHLGRDIPVVMTKKSTNLKFPSRVYQLIYCRYFNRTFDNSKIAQFCDVNSFTLPQVGLAKCLEDFLKAPHFNRIPWDIEAVNDKVTGERTPLREIPHMGNKFTYFCYRNSLTFLLKPTFRLLNIARKIKNKLFN